MNFKLYFCSGVMFVTLVSQAQGSTHEQTLSPTDFFEELPVVLSASRLRQSADQAPSAVTVIDREMIVASGARQLVDVLRLAPGFYVGYVNGSSPIAAYHGLSEAYSKKMQVLVDGVSIYSPIYGGVEWNELPLVLQDIERIEIVRGPNAATYGANAFLGVINIITRDPATESHFYADTNIGGNGIRDMVARLANKGEDWRYRVSLSQRYDDGFTNLPDSSRIDVANLRAHYRLNSVDELAFQLRSSSGREYQGFCNTGADDPGAMRPRDVRQNTLQLRWTRAQSSDDEIWAQVHHHEHLFREGVSFSILLPKLPPIPYSINFNTDTKRDDIEFQQSKKVVESLRMVWGGQWREDGVRSKTFFNTDEWLNNRLSRLFGNAEWRPLEKMTVNGGAMFEHNSMTGSSTSPRLAATYSVHPGHCLRIGIAWANRAPTLYEAKTYQVYNAPAVLAPLAKGLPLKITVQSVGPLEDEKILSREVGYVVELPQWKFSGDIRYFNDQIDNLIYGATTQPVNALLNKKAFDYFNQPGAVHERGYELSGQWRPWSGVQLHATAAYTRIDSELPDTLQSAPRHTRTLLLQQALPGNFALSAAYYRVGSMRWQNAPSGLPAYDTVDLRLSKQFRWKNQRAELALVTRNALGSYLDYNLNNHERRISYLQLNFAY